MSKYSLPSVVDSKVMLLLGQGGQFKSVNIEGEQGSIATIDAFGKCTWKDATVTPVTEEALLALGFRKLNQRAPIFNGLYILPIDDKNALEVADIRSMGFAFVKQHLSVKLESLEHLQKIARALRIELGGGA